MLLDEEDFEKFKDVTVYYVKGGYPSFNNNGVRTYVHRYLMNAKEDDVVDHKNMNILDNRKENLRLTTHVYNHGNAKKYNMENPTSKYKGVTYDKINKNWIARVVYNQKVFYRGRYENEESAALAYNFYAKKAFGEFAYLNSVDDQDEIDWESNVITREPAIRQSGYKYITWDTSKDKWVGAVTKDGKQHKLITTDCIIEGLLAVNEYILQHELFLLKRHPRKFQEAKSDHIRNMTIDQLEVYRRQIEEYKNKSDMLII